MKMPKRAVAATRFVHSLLQTMTDEKILAVEGVPQRKGVPYHLYQSESESSTEGFDVRVEYDDSYVVTCEVILYPGRNPRLSGCQPFP